jgi:hypothetical protein
VDFSGDVDVALCCLLQISHALISQYSSSSKMNATVGQPPHTHSCDFHDALSVRPAATASTSGAPIASSSGNTGGRVHSNSEAECGVPGDYVLYGMDVCVLVSVSRAPNFLVTEPLPLSAEACLIDCHK